MSFNPLARQAMLARENADAVAANPALADIPTDDFARAAEQQRLARIAERTARVRRAQEEADELAARAVRFDEAIEQHAATERAEKPRITKVRKTLEASRKAMCTAAVAAQEALSAAQRAANAHDQAVAGAARELLAAGLPASYADADVRHDFATGATRDGKVILDGQAWVRVNPDAVALRALYGAARAWTGEHDGLGGRLHYDPAVRKLEHHSAGVMAGAPLPAAFVPPRDTSMDEIRAAHNALITGAMVIMSDSTRDQLERDRQTEEKRSQMRTAQAKRDYVEYRLNAVEELGEQRVLELEARNFHDGKPFGLDPAQLVAEVSR